MKKEIWKDVIGYEGSYQVSNLGRVKSLKFNRKNILRPSVNARGYLQVNIGKTINVHKLVAIAFLNHVPNGMTLVVDHINNNKLDNRVDNLQIITQKENTLKSLRENSRRYSDKSNKSSQYTGVCWDKENYKWKSHITINGKLTFLGRFVNEFDASQAYQTALKNLI